MMILYITEQWETLKKVLKSLKKKKVIIEIITLMLLYYTSPKLLFRLTRLKQDAIQRLSFIIVIIK
jgi:HKD family nuclease